MINEIKNITETSQKENTDNFHQITIRYDELMVHFIKDEEECEDEFLTIIDMDAIYQIDIDQRSLSDEDIEELISRSFEQSENAENEKDKKSPYYPLWKTTSYNPEEITKIELIQSKGWLTFEIEDAEFNLNNLYLQRQTICYYNENDSFEFEQEGFTPAIIYKDILIQSDDWNSREIARDIVYEYCPDEDDDEFEE